MKKKILEVSVLVIFILSFFCMSANAMTRSEFDLKLAKLQQTYYDGKQQTYYEEGQTCFGYAYMIAKSVFGTSASTWTKSYDLSGVKAGDVVQYGNTSGNGHTIFVTSVSGDTITYTDCNSDWQSTIHWGSTVSKSSNAIWSYSFAYRLVAPELDEPVDIGTNFYAVIVNVKAWKHLHIEDNGNVVLRSAQNSTRQIWKFERQSDLSYKIISTYDGKLLDVDGAGKTNGTNVQTFVDHNHAAQQWFFYGKSGHYYMRAKHSDLYLDLNGNNSSEGTNIQMWEYNGGDAQIWQVYHTDMNKPTLTVKAGTSETNTHLSWSSSLGTNVYNARIKKDDDDYTIWNVTGTECDKILPAGNYKAYIDACNATSVRSSNAIYFTVEEAPNNMPFKVTYNDGYVEVANTLSTKQKAAVIITEYENGALKDVSSANVTFAAGETKTYNFTGSGTHKVFVWNSLDGMVPLAK